MDYHQCVPLTPLPHHSGFKLDSFWLAVVAFVASWGAACLALCCLCRPKGRKHEKESTMTTQTFLEGDHDYVRRRRWQSNEDQSRQELKDKATQLHWFA